MPIFAFQKLLTAYHKCRQGKRYTINAINFEQSLEKSLLALGNGLTDRTYRPKTYVRFPITDPKLREVWAADFRDRIVHHLLVSYLKPIFEPKFIFHSYACRQNKGAHSAISHLKKTINSLSFYLQIDIQSFFTSIDKNILYSIITKQIHNPDILYLSRKIIFHNPVKNHIQKGNIHLLNSISRHKSLLSSKKNSGLPIGNLTSQFFANLYLNELDQFVKHKLKSKHYLRYMDDMVFLSASKQDLLLWRKEVSIFLYDKLKLKLHPKKQVLQPITHGIDFLGYIVKPTHILSRRRVVASLKRKLFYFNQEINKNAKIKPKFALKIQSTINSYYGHFKHADCYRLRKKLYDKNFKELRLFLIPANNNFSYFVALSVNNIIYRLWQGRIVKLLFYRPSLPTSNLLAHIFYLLIQYSQFSTTDYF